MPTSFLVVDDFLSPADAQGLRRAGLGLDYPEQDGAFPGRNSLQRLEMQGLAGAASRLLNEPLRPVQPLQSHGKFRLTLANDVGRARVHTDHSHWSGILYLSAPEHCQGGTEFFRHRRTNTDRLALNPAELAALGYADGAAMHRDIIERDSNDESAWEPTMTIPMRFNRLVLLRPWFWHTAGPAFGDCAENGRLVYLMFFEQAG
ncbi:hypothetical protein C1922_13885 [Stenotrophomonas sp. ZAC14D2_NAIMI4_7]|uniref:DUF6445 family protein n=1 Tax=Stenotrophomonas TaxID=40323 RepID=UPI000D542C1A|nr:MULTISPECIES: DUF6445 family protein [Stenotrophomonas]AWH18309.1 hypothetical protein C1922_13885 [Stenotrophomonas sp. ZAC14D2_NAIMI4_7]AWH22928.1 hypothetical protein C1933_17705 [Stenotrophomonas sp. ZAC14D2_NAIMI4_6]